MPDNRGPLFCDPYPLSDKFFLVSCNPERPWNGEQSYELVVARCLRQPGADLQDPEMSCWQPMPLRPRPTPPVVARGRRGRPTAPTGRATRRTLCRLGRRCPLARCLRRLRRACQPGEIKYLRVLEQVPRPWTAHRFWPDDAALGQNAIISLNSHIHVKLLHGVVPVQPDGSAHFTVPADRNLFFQALDENFQEIQRMRTFVNLRPGECGPVSAATSRAIRRCRRRPRGPAAGDDLAPAAAVAQPGETLPRAVDYRLDVQPIWDQHCVRCHGGERTDGELDLSGELTTYFNRSYENLMQRGQDRLHPGILSGRIPGGRRRTSRPCRPRPWAPTPAGWSRSCGRAIMKSSCPGTNGCAW